jgi:flagellar hook-associated protein 3 FlgL
MFTRVTNLSMTRSAQYNLQNGLAALSKLQNTASSQKAIALPSDDPAGTAKSLQVNGQQAATTQYGRNIDDGSSWLTTIDTTLSSTSDLMRQVRDLTTQGANDGALPTSAKDSIINSLQGLRDELLKQANTTYQGRNVFAGNSDAGAAFNSDLSYNGDGSTVQRRVDDNTTVRVDADGGAIFGTGSDSAFALIDNIVSDLQNGTNVGPRLTELDQRMSTISAAQASVGTAETQLDRAKVTNQNTALDLESQRSSVEDIDLASVVLDLQSQQTTYQASLALTAKVLQPTLMDFLN